MEFHVFHCFSLDIPSCFVCNYFSFQNIMLKFSQDVAQTSWNLPALSKIGRFGNRRPQTLPGGVYPGNVKKIFVSELAETSAV